MTPRILAELLAVLAMLHSGRTKDAAEALAEIVRAHGADVQGEATT